MVVQHETIAKEEIEIRVVLRITANATQIKCMNKIETEETKTVEQILRQLSELEIVSVEVTRENTQAANERRLLPVSFESQHFFLNKIRVKRIYN